MKRVSLGIVVYLIWEERNKRIFDKSVDVIFRKFQSCVLGHCCYKVSSVAQVSMKASGEFFLERALSQLICLSDLLCFAIITGGSAFLVLIGYLLMEVYCAGDLFCCILIFPCSRGLLLHSLVHSFAKSRLEREPVVFLSLWPWCLLLSFFLAVWFENMLLSSCPASSRYCQLSWDP
ncbi:hypothetical protein NC653_008331 [Populus alba x Populus x berolinensis]|uniref:Uncharacterized protein n=2 Tax=Populus alba x Populus x berolinensis TaxID=444605 RepID=A0AAD6R6D6_9ROSI|nr:hypothetical protein NC653_008331 [Populus alba x Populus x berolinensis]